MPPRILPLAGLVLFASQSSAQDLTLESHASRWRLSVESFEASNSDDLDVVGVNYDLLDVAPGLLPDLYLGVGGYGAVTGTAGGLLYAGASVGWLKELYPGWNLDLGGMVGAGGGGGADTGGGLFLRPHIALERAIGAAGLRLELARLDFTSGDLASTHLALGVTLSGEVLRAGQGKRPAHISAANLFWRRMRITPTMTQFMPEAGMLRKDGVIQEDDIVLTGLGFDYFLSDSIYLPVEFSTASGGGVGGFTAALAGLGGSWPIFAAGMSVEAKAMVGSGGGGEVDTGGGLLWSASGGLSWALSNGLSFQALAGRLSAPDGDMEGATLSAGLSWSPYFAELAWNYPRYKLAEEGISGSIAQLSALRLEGLHKSYFPSSTSKKTDGSSLSDPIHMAGAGIAIPFEMFNQDWATTVRVFSAWDGDAGGFNEGMVGLQYEMVPFKTARFHTVYMRGEVGAGGGGDVDVGSGLMYQLAAGWRFQYSSNLGASIDFGSVESDRGTLEGESLTLGVSFMLSRPSLRW